MNRATTMKLAVPTFPLTLTLTLSHEGRGDNNKVTPQVEKLAIAMRGEMTPAEAMEAVALKDRMHFATDYLQPALASGLVEMTLPDKPRSGNQRYRLTARGRALVEMFVRRGTKPDV